MNINWGLIGCGRIANNRVIPEGILDAKNSSLIGVSDVIEDRAKSTANEFNIKKLKTSGCSGFASISHIKKTAQK